MSQKVLQGVRAEIGNLSAIRHVGRIERVDAEVLTVTGLGRYARLGDILKVTRGDGSVLHGEVVQLQRDTLTLMPDQRTEGVSLGDRVVLRGPLRIAPDDGWIGRVIDPHGQPLDDKPILPGRVARGLRGDPPPPAKRRALGARLETATTVLNTLLPIVEGQRIGLFAGSGVGKSRLMGHLAARMQADVAVIALVGERGRELREFTDKVLGPEGMKRAVVVAATSDRSALVRRRCAWTAMAVAEHFRDQGKHVLFLADSITRFAEAHREVAVASGELPALRGYPPSTAYQIMQLCERAGPGADPSGTITAVLSVLVAGSDMEEPVADILRGVLDGHIVMDRQIAERGRYPAIDLLRSVSRSLPEAATEEENKMIAEARHLLSAYARSEMMIQAGLYVQGSDPVLDQAIRAWPDLDTFLAEDEENGITNSFNRLQLILRRSAAAARSVSTPKSRRDARPAPKGLPNGTGRG
ncbi:flagellum-specific ATP synthase [Pseudooceanicola antarcticus]|uniref:Flagellum-specific ATP synthase n=1 Tax=Pseudooceanicola antarcticus TaxID=1247613 RepID=A0A285HW23_9RHOB|nr:FliI/YscN family ATPase [Pseudooceanicola antarcticus]PJE27411.1 FliI/YscN family ATPase [Pseudooceanicola antarcticus]SNY39889.1 flagellum-specific ATP synthase [Pseudooceanicola antarcticus]